jgi:hypothetical protein
LKAIYVDTEITVHWADGGVAPLVHIILIPSQTSLYHYSLKLLLRGEVTNVNFIVWFDPTGALHHIIECKLSSATPRHDIADEKLLIWR